jgi:hypothetical protein
MLCRLNVKLSRYAVRDQRGGQLIWLSAGPVVRRIAGV